MGLIFSNYDYQIALQDAQGTPATAPTHYLLCLANSNMTPAKEYSTVKVGEGNRASDGISFVSGCSAAGSLIVVAQDKMMPLVNYLALGDLDKTGDADPFSWAATINQTEGVPYFTLWKGVAGLYEIYPDCKINTCRLQTATDGENRLLRYVLDILSVGDVRFKTAAPAAPATSEGRTVYWVWDHAKTAWKVDGGAEAAISQFELEIANNLTVVPGEGLTGHALHEGECTVKTTSRLYMSDLAHYLNFMYGSDAPEDDTGLSLTVPTGSFETKFTRVAGAVGPPAVAERSLAIATPDLSYAMGEPPKVEGDPTGAPQYVTLAGIAQGDDPKVTLTVKNGESAYLS